MSKYKGLTIGSVLLVLLSVLAVIPSASAATANICGVKFNDKNGDRVQGADENGLNGWTIDLIGEDLSGTVPIPVNISTKTHPAGGTARQDGVYCFNDIPPGKYTVKEELPPVLVEPRKPPIGALPPNNIIRTLFWTPTTPLAVYITVNPAGMIIDSMGTPIERINFGNRLWEIKVELPCISVAC